MECHRKLAKCHHGFGDGELALIMLLGLPKSYEPLILSLEQQEEKLSTSVVKSKLLLEEKRQKQRQIPQEDPNCAFALQWLKTTFSLGNLVFLPDCLPLNSCKGQGLPATCRCDQLCHKFGDCCHDAEVFDLTYDTSIWSCKPHIRGSAVRVIQRCPEEEDAEIQKICSSGGLLEDPFTLVPVTSTVTGITYSNAFCASCNSDINVIPWKLELLCLQEGSPSYSVSSTRWGIYPKNDSFEECFFQLVPPTNNISLRSCNPYLYQNCDGSPCLKHHAWVQDPEGHLFINAECASCNGIVSTLSCVENISLDDPTGLPQMESLSILLDMISYDGNPRVNRVVASVESRHLCDGPNQVYDSFFNKCREFLFMELNQYDGGGGGSQQANKRPRSEDEDLLPSSHHQFKFNSTANLFNFECQTFEAIIADTSLDSPEKIQMATKGLILTLVQEAELLLKDTFKGASLGRPNPTANVPIPSTSFASVVAEKDKPVKPAPPKPKAKSTFVNLAPSFESHVVVRVDGEVRDDEICESFRSNHSVQSLLEKREIRVVHRSNNAAHSTSTVFIEVDNQVAEILGQHGRIPVAGLVHRPLRVLQVNAKKSPTVILEIANLANSTQADIVLLQELSTNFFWPTHTAITSIAICLEQSIIVVHSAYWHGLRAADDFIPLLEDTIRRTSLPVILGMDTNAHSPTWGIGARLDFRGANLEEFASFNDFHFLGPPVDSTWSNGPLSSSIDVTLASISLAIHVTRDMVNNETKFSWVESSCKEQTFKSFLNSSLHQRLADRHGWFFEDQYKTVLGTVNGRSAEDALASITQLIEERQAHWRKTLVISSDIKSITCLVKSFLEDRTVSYSAWTATECTSSQLGTPQGSSLRPFLWNIVARTIFTLPFIIDSRLIAYADDFTLMTQKMENSVQVPKFDGENFASWKFRIVSILEGKELDDLLECDPPEDEVKFKEWKKKDAQAKGIITCAMTDSLVALILNCKTSKNIWIALHERYEGDKKKRIIEARNDVSRLTMKKEENWEEYLYRSEKLLEQARNLGAEIEDQEFTTSVIRGLPQKYNLVALQLNCQMKAKFVNLQPEEHVSNIKENETTQQPEEWVIDSGASCHMTSNRDLLKEEREVHKTIKLADDSEIISNAEGAIEIEGQNKLIRLNDVLYVEKLSGNLMSVNKLVDDNKKVLFDKDGGHIMEEDGEEILMAQRINDFYIIKTSAPEEIPSQALKATLHTWNDWHKRLGHLNEEYMKQMLKNNSAHNFNTQSQNMDTCQVCIQAKHPRTPFKPVLYPQSTRPLDLIHIDLIGPIQEESIGGAKYVLTLVDDFSRKIFVEFLSSKLETFDIIRSFIEEIEKEKEIKVKQLRSDNGKEFTNHQMTQYLKEETIPETSEEVENHDDHSHSDLENQDEHSELPYNLRPNLKDKLYYELSSDDEPIEDNEDKDPTYDPTVGALKLSHGNLLPSSYEEAINHPDSPLWQQAMDKEIHSLQNHHVWDLTELPEGAKAIKSKWIFSKKMDPQTNQEIYKARLVALGCSQEYGTDYTETFSPVMKTDSFRTLLAYATMAGYEFHHFDVETAFLYGKLSETIYMTQPPGYQDDKKKTSVCILNQALYGLKQSGRVWSVLEKSPPPYLQDMAMFGQTWFSGVLGKTHLAHIVWRNNRLWTTFYSDALLSSNTE
ncbi:hypothetical protein LAZ67_3001003 [Cordylochernes scorpioides]|uniref:Integrase catalytic domain-containing protein n=1 Tax=Cordylochernes scorpioides TaxID=51811 RepID=A0ABY6K6K4_9ARAC|nr:hypothetical protein LAZ67_3001003 [Cordylochernes scorpioides]